MRYWNRSLLSATRRAPSTTESSGIFDLNSQLVYKKDNKWPVPGVYETDLILHLDAGNTNSYSGSGTTWYDLTSNNRDAELVNGAGYNSSDGGYIDFDGTDDFARITESSFSTFSLFDGTNDFTVALWFNTDAFPSTNAFDNSPTLFAVGRRFCYFALGDGQPTDKLSWRANQGGTIVHPVSSNTLSTNTWYNICMTYSASSGYVMYQNGSSVSTSSETGAMGNRFGGYSYIATYPGSSTKYFNGSISNILVYDSALSSAQALQNFNALKGRYGL